MKPEQKFREGGISATVWRNTSKEGKEYASISFERNYKDLNNEWKTTNKLRVDDLPKAITVLSKTAEYLAQEKIQDQTSSEEAVQEAAPSHAA